MSFPRGPAWLAVLVLLAAPAVADPSPPGDGFRLPAACGIGTTCWVVNYPDAGRPDGKVPLDYRCGSRTYAGHDGTDIALADRRAVAAGVAVLAAAPGIVEAVRDGEADGLYLAGKADKIAGKECGNGVVLRHGGGWQTQYCHLRRGSLAVAPGEKVAAGARLGLIGLSGKSEFPHLHFAVRRQGRKIDPFTGRTAGGGCGVSETPLWAAGTAPAYPHALLYAAGLAARVPEGAEVKADVSLPGLAPGRRSDLVGWGAAYDLAKGDRLDLELAGPGGESLARRSVAAEHPKAWQMIAVGRRLPPRGWDAGTYRLTARVVRDGRTLGERSARFEMPGP